MRVYLAREGEGRASLVRGPADLRGVIPGAVIVIRGPVSAEERGRWAVSVGDAALAGARVHFEGE